MLLLEVSLFQVWMDIDQTGSRSTLEAMPEAVESADFILVCFSQRYKNSPSCRAGKVQDPRLQPFLKVKVILTLREVILRHDN